MKPFLTGRSVSTANSLQPLVGARPSETSPRSGAHVHPQGTNPQLGAIVESIKQGDKVVRLVVTCTCGERIEIDCLYPPGA